MPGETNLTPRQAQVARLAGEGLTDRQIGIRLGISTRTVSNYLGAAYVRLGITDRCDIDIQLLPKVEG